MGVVKNAEERINLKLQNVQRLHIWELIYIFNLPCNYSMTVDYCEKCQSTLVNLDNKGFAYVFKAKCLKTILHKHYIGYLRITLACPPDPIGSNCRVPKGRA